MGNKLTIARLNNTDFPKLYEKFILGKDFSEKNLITVLSIAVFLINLEDVLFQQLGYRIIVNYCNRYKNYYPLYEIAINYGLYPISKFIETKYVKDDDRNFFTFWNDAHAEQYKKGNIFLTEQQYNLNDFFNDNIDKDISVVAPTSYGKSELIIKTIEKYRDKKICVLTTTKALLMQTKRRIKETKIVDEKIIIHPEMYCNNENFVAILTQERLLRLFKKDRELFFDCIILDEAHEILEENLRSNLLASVIIIAQKRNQNTVFKFLTPFVSDAKNLRPKYMEMGLSTFKINEYIKTENYFLYDMTHDFEICFYDQFINKFLKIDKVSENTTEKIIVRDNAAKKNIVYMNKPINIEEFALELAELLPEVHSEEIRVAVKNIATYLKPQYNLLTCLKKGVIYHHGSVPDIIRLYIEDLYKNVPDIKFIITTSTLLSGVNLSADRMFILDNKKGKANLSSDAFRNLVGRVCRFSEIFDIQNGDLKLLEPQIHIIFGKYVSINANGKKFLEKVARVDRSNEDRVENVLLKETKITESNAKSLREASEFIENYESGTIKNYNNRYTETDIGKSCIMNGIREIDVFVNEKAMQEKVNQCLETNKIIKNPKELLAEIQNIFINYICDNDFNEIKRLKNNEALIFYSMMLEWRMYNKSYSEMIQLFLKYWENLYLKNQNAYIYVGRWGNISFGEAHNKVYVYLKDLNSQNKINLAIVRIKEEQDFVDNILIKFVEVLHDLGLVDEGFYKRIKYGTDNEEVICLVKNGLSLSLSLLLVEKYRSYIQIDIADSFVKCNEELITTMESENENQILLFEVKNYI